MADQSTQISRPQAYRLIDAAGVVANLSQLDRKVYEEIVNSFVNGKVV